MLRSTQRRRLARQLGMLYGLKDGAAHIINRELGVGIEPIYDPRADLAKEIIGVEKDLSTRTRGFGRKKRIVKDSEGEKIVQRFRDMRNK